MRELPLKKESASILAEYGLSNISLDVCKHMLFSSGETVIQQGNMISRLCIVIKGQAKTCRDTPGGKNLILCYYLSDGLIGEIELMAGMEKAITTVIAISDLECVTIDYNVCARELKTNQLFLHKLAVILANKLVASSDNFASSALCTGEQRLCSYILQASPQNIFRAVLSDVSCSIGISYRHMFRLLGQLCAEGILEKQECGYNILKREELILRAN